MNVVSLCLSSVLVDFVSLRQPKALYSKAYSRFVLVSWLNPYSDGRRIKREKEVAATDICTGHAPPVDQRAEWDLIKTLRQNARNVYAVTVSAVLVDFVSLRQSRPL